MAFGAVAGEVAVTATNSGTFIALVSDGNGAFSGSGIYRLTLATTRSLPLVSPGDEGGPFNGSSNYVGAIDAGDLDVLYFTACRGDGIEARMDELVNGSSLSPWLRLYVRDGVLLKSVSGAATAQISVAATNTGNFFLVAGDGSTGLGGSGAYQLTANGLSAGVKLCIPVIAGTKATLTGIGGPPGTNFILFTHTNVITPFAFWTPLLTNQFDAFGVFNATNPFSRAERERYFRLLEP